eukprot:2409970-Pyramimonas_sp.AAC.1
MSPSRESTPYVRGIIEVVVVAKAGPITTPDDPPSPIGVSSMLESTLYVGIEVVVVGRAGPITTPDDPPSPIGVSLMLGGSDLWVCRHNRGGGSS